MSRVTKSACRDAGVWHPGAESPWQGTDFPCHETNKAFHGTQIGIWVRGSKPLARGACLWLTKSKGVRIEELGILRISGAGVWAFVSLGAVGLKIGRIPHSIPKTDY